MQLLVIRHARAESVKEFAKTGAADDLRPLTGDGEERMRLGAAGLHRLVEEIDVLATSPLVRTRQTAEIVAAEFGGPGIVELDELRPEATPSAFVEWLQDAGSKETIAIVGHDMQLVTLVGLLLTGTAETVVRIKKGAALLLDVGERRRGHAGLRSGRLLWSLTPRQLRMLGADLLPEAPADAQRAEQ
ncbi:MAG: SixA phosphatase family protein [Longimicrobiales bacterium]